MKRLKVSHAGGRAAPAVLNSGNGSFNAEKYDPTSFPSLATPWEERKAKQQGEMYSPRYLVCTRSDGDSFSGTKPLFFVQHLEDKFGEVAALSKMKNGSVLVTTASSAQSRALLACTKLGDIPVVFTPHKNLNSVQGLIFHRDLLLQTDDELRADLERRGVRFVRRVQRGPKNNKVDTGAFILAFDGDVLPEKVKVMVYRCIVKPYIPPPMRCFRCYKFGHMSSRCDTQPICRDCGKASHEGSPCTPPPMCVNCGEQHSPCSPDCSIYLQEKKIQEYKTLDRLTYREARMKFDRLNPVPMVRSYAAMSTKASLSLVGAPQPPTPSVSGTTTRRPPVQVAVEAPLHATSSSNKPPRTPHSSGTSQPETPTHSPALPTGKAFSGTPLPPPLVDPRPDVSQWLKEPPAAGRRSSRSSSLPETPSDKPLKASKAPQEKREREKERDRGREREREREKRKSRNSDPPRASAPSDTALPSSTPMPNEPVSSQKLDPSALPLPESMSIDATPPSPAVAKDQGV